VQLSLWLILLSILALTIGAFLAMLLRRSPAAATLAGSISALLACTLGFTAAARALYLGGSAALSLHWSVPYGAFALQLDPLASFFLLPIFALSGFAALYGAGYMRAYGREKSLGAPWFWFNALAATMALVILSANGVLFLMAWEAMSLSSFFLVTFEHEQARVRHAGWVYLVATHLGGIALFLLFVLMGRASGSMDFSQFHDLPLNASAISLLFLLAVIGFGTKAGFMPLHVWLPEAHPVAPSHVSALMSGVMIKTGLYGILRMLTFLGPPPEWWGWLLIGIGVSSGLLGVIFALAQHDLKRLLAYSSVENIGIIAMALGIGLLGLSTGHLPIAALGFAAALLHIINHAVFKGLLFLGAGSVLHATHTLAIDQLGGLLKRMPVTGTVFLIGAIAICGLPPFNGFASEFLIYVASFRGITTMQGFGATASLAIIGVLALIGGLAAVCFAKAFGISFLGEARTAQAQSAHECAWPMRLPMIVLAALCLALGMAAPLIITHAMAAPLAMLCRCDAQNIQAMLAPAMQSLQNVVIVGTGLLLLIGLLAGLRLMLLSRRSVEQTGTWDCGYAQPTARMQYTGSSFVQPLVDFFCAFLRTRRQSDEVKGLFPREASLQTHSRDLFTERLYDPIFSRVGNFMARLQQLQTHSIHLCILYIAATLIILLVWKLK